MRLLIKTELDKERAIEIIRKMKVDKPLEVNIVVQRKKRSLPQNRLLHLWLKCISDETGNSHDSLYEYFCEKYLPWNKELVFNREVRTRSGSSQLNTKEFTEFLDSINSEMLDQGIYLPNPGDMGWDDFYSRYK